MNKKMTVFFRKSNGDLTDIIQDEQNMSVYGDLQADYEMIYDFVVVDYDEYVMINKNLFCIVDGKLKLKNSEELQKYL
ncbi:hypothetical protein [Clostridium beijerinckii]|uniref:Uncharacterized protein n=1 Tax=Clostridium beijerinckii TaxID=1520 RepID=A0A9Q5GF21_CLOBE|nr:hypothetical protein [Clostridium beijerinckii]AQS04798.1 hypothetical protein CLBIJ_22280 [Clostridium beijerinckii]MBA2887525.1 hypothetical protein [Clostridium beijerinckii]MBA2902415.1 hypothetical protein [Clostridium beijerinckii]MBA2912295.1 hypothetical protein [Clostridium beijerinckii]MBA9015643.1 hypothetical protein [Clostridium beijerinckii]